MWETPFLLFGGLETYCLGRLGVSLIESLAICKLGAAAESSRVEHPGEVCTKTTREAVQRLEDALYNVALSHTAKKLVRLIFALEKSGRPYCPAI